MAKSNFLAMMKAKPNARGKRSHLPLYCSVAKCEEDFLVSYGKDSYPPKRYCKEHAPFNKVQEPTDLLTLTLDKLARAC